MAPQSSPMPLIGAPGSSVSLSALLSYELGSTFSFSKGVYVFFRGAGTLAATDFSYWDLAHKSITSVSIGGTPLAADQSNYLSPIQLSQAAVNIGDQIAPNLNVAVSSTSGSVTSWQWLSFNTVNPAVASPARNVVDPVDVVAAATRFAGAYTGVPNDNDCHNIASDIAAAAGASLPVSSGSTDPTQNQSGGFWRDIYRGSDSGAIANWQSVVQPGDIVRMAWQGGGQHTTLVVGRNADGSIQVFDNAYWPGSSELIGTHNANYDQKTIASSITIYRLDPNHIYLVQGSETNDVLIGSPFTNEIHTGGGIDSIVGGSGNDHIYLDGWGGKTVSGNGGLDTVILPGATSQFTIKIDTSTGTASASGMGITAALTEIARIQTADSYLALDINGDAGQAYRLYQAALNRTPETSGLSWHVNQRDQGMSLHDDAANFMSSPEFAQRYGAAPSDQTFVTALYANVLSRAPDATGQSYWLGHLADGSMDRATVLAGFSESPENHGRVDPTIKAGIYLDHGLMA